MESGRVEGVKRRARGKAASEKTRERLNRLIEEEWPALPYIMMRLTAAAGFKNGKRMYWRDQRVQLGEVELHLIESSDDGAFIYTAIYSAEDHSREEFRRDLLVPLHPSLEGQELRWSAPSVWDKADLTSEELAEVLLAKLVKFNASDFPQ